MELPRTIRCHKCRSDLAVPLTVDAHGGNGDQNSECTSMGDRTMIFLAEDRLPPWIRDKVEQEGWMKGKLHCSSCGGKLGSFDFVSGRKCCCGFKVLPPVHLIRSQVDAAVKIDILNSNDPS